MKNTINHLKAIAICFIFIASNQLQAQIGIGVTGAVNSTAALEVTSTTRGLLPPRLTTTQRDAIALPAGGIPRRLEISAHGSFKSSAAGFLNMAFGIFKNGVCYLNRFFLPQIQPRQPQGCILSFI